MQGRASNALVHDAHVIRTYLETERNQISIGHETQEAIVWN